MNGLKGNAKNYLLKIRISHFRVMIYCKNMCIEAIIELKKF